MTKKITQLLSVLLLLSISGKGNAQIPQTLAEEAFRHVNPFIGTSGDGHCYPGATVPFGMVQLSPDTGIKSYKESYPWCAGYQYTDTSILGFSHTHFSGTGHSDLGDILLMPTTGKIQLEPGSKENPDSGYRSRFNHEDEEAQPGYYRVKLQDYGINAELTSTTRCGFHRYTFPPSDQAHILMDLVSSIYNYEGKTIWSEVRVENNHLITGYRHTRGWARSRHLYFAIEFSKDFDSCEFWNGDPDMYGHKASDELQMNLREMNGKKIKAVFNFNTKEDEQILVRVGISAISTEGAIRNLREEIPHWNFDQVKEEAKNAWMRELPKITIEGNRREKEIFYTALYHTMLAPVTYMDVDGKYRGVDQNIHQAENFTNYTIFSLWDTYRATHPLFTIIQPERNADMITSMLKHYQQSVHGILPIWSFHGNETWCMIGYHAVSVIADAYLKGIRNFDTELAWKAVLASSTHQEYDGLDEYMKRGYIPIDKEDEAASKVLEYAYDDFTIAQMGKAMGKMDKYSEYLTRAQYYRNIYDQQSGFMRAKKSDGNFREPFDPFYAQYGGDYTEGNAWQYSWYVPQDVKGLIALMGGERKFTEKLDSLFILEDPHERHKAVEDISGLIGQYAHGNEPSQHIAYLYNWARKPWKTQERIHQIMNNLFDNSPDGICGNEDCGQMSSWYIFSSLGFYPVCPGTNQYVIGSPSLRKATIYLPNNKRFTVKTKNLSDENIYIKRVLLNGKPWNASYINHKDIVNGGELVFIMSDEPSKHWATSMESVPYSITP